MLFKLPSVIATDNPIKPPRVKLVLSSKDDITYALPMRETVLGSELSILIQVNRADLIPTNKGILLPGIQPAGPNGILVLALHLPQHDVYIDLTILN